MGNRSRGSPLPLKTKVGFGAAEFSSSLTWTMIAIVFMYFLTDVVGLNPAFAGFVLMIGTLWDAVTDPTLGIISDRSNSRWGRRRPLLLATAIPYGLATWLLFSDFGLGGTATQLYFIAAIILYFTAATMLEIPYTSLTAEMTQDYDERANLISFRAVFSQVGSIVGAASPWVLVAAFTEYYGNEKTAWSTTAALFGVASVFPILWTWHASRGFELQPKNVVVNFKDILSGPLKNRTFRYTMAMFAAGNVALGASGSIAVYFMKYYMQFTESQQSMAYFFLFSCTILWIPVINLCTTKFGKRESYMAFIGVWATVQAVGIMLLEPSMNIIFYGLMILASGGIISVSLTGLSMIPDAIEVDEFKSGQRREGLYVGVNMFVRKFSVALVLWLVGIALSAIGYVPDQVQSDQALFGIRLLYAQGTAFFLLVSAILAFYLPMTRKRHAALRTAIDLKSQGKSWDETAIKPLL